MPDEAGMVGVDEVGRGAWAGPLVVAAVGLNRPVEGLNDSKKLSAAQRTKAAARIERAAFFIGLGQSSAAEIDRLGLTKATTLAIKRAIAELDESTWLIIDGKYNYLPGRSRVRTQIGADALVPAVMAASIIAKVQRDKLMSAQAGRWPDYGFERHVGYGTALHQQAIERLGLCPEHRRSFKPIGAHL